jgi:hypothetical protein
MRFFVSSLAAVLAAAMPTLAMAAYNYTFNVPVTLNNMPAGAVSTLECSLYQGINASGGQIGTATAMLTTSSAQQNMSIPVSAPTKPGSYSCWVVVSAKIGSTASINIQNGTPTAPVPGWTGQMVTTANIP